MHFRHPPSIVLWTLADWRCEQHSSYQLRLFQSETVIAEHSVRSADLVQRYAELWHSAIAEIAQPAAATE